MLVRYSAEAAYPIPIALRLFFPLSSSSSLLLLRLGPARGGGSGGLSTFLACGALNKNRLIPPPVLADPVPDGRVTGVLPPALPSSSIAPRLRRPFDFLRAAAVSEAVAGAGYTVPFRRWPSSELRWLPAGSLLPFLSALA
jgi:hypothetical protein